MTILRVYYCYNLALSRGYIPFHNVYSCYSNYSNIVLMVVVVISLFLQQFAFKSAVHSEDPPSLTDIFNIINDVCTY